MNAVEIQARIERELNGHPQWLYGASDSDVHTGLLTPIKRSYRDSTGHEMQLWLLGQWPHHGGGYQIVYDETENMYGLAIQGNEHDVFLGYYGTFVETFNGM